VDEAVTLREAAARFGVNVDRLRKAAYDGRLEVRRVMGSRERVVLPSEVERFLREGGQAPAPRIVPLVGAGTGTARVIAVAIPKGGTGKTTTALNLGAAFAEQGKRVLLVDLDPQGSLTLALGIRVRPGMPTVYSSIVSYLRDYEQRLDQAIIQVRPNLDLAPSNTALNLANGDLINARRREYVLQNLLEPLKSIYDIIVIDTLPYLGILVENALVAAGEVLIPTQAQYLSSESVALIYQQIKDIRRSNLNPDLRVCGILLTQVQPDRLVDRHFREEIRQLFGQEAAVFQTEILADASVQKSQAMAPPQTVLEFAPVGDVANAYRALAREVWNAA
jgi:chromosome partitioning protein